MLQYSKHGSALLFTEERKGFMVDLGCAHSPWCFCAHALQGWECSYLCKIHAINTFLQMRCSQARWFGQKQKWDSRPRKQSFKCKSQTPAHPQQAPPAGSKWDNEPPLPSPFCQVSSALSSPFSPSLHPRVSLVETLLILHTPVPTVCLSPCCSYCSWHIPTSLFFFHLFTKRDMFGGFPYTPVLQICTELSWHCG